MLCAHLLTVWLALAAAQVIYTGFNYGATWSNGTFKVAADFEAQFNRAKSLGTSIPFNSARLFTSIQGNSGPSEAFPAAIKTNTSLLLGIWVSPTGIEAELKALDDAFAEHGSNLANLVAGISVGNEDIYSACKDKPENAKAVCTGDASNEIKSRIKEVRNHISSASWKTLFSKPLPIGHTEIASFPVTDEVDFVGMTAYPYWYKQSVANAKQSFFGKLGEVQNGSGETPVWIAETGWPFSGKNNGEAVAGADQMQQYWTEVGCLLFGKYNTWWFQLEKDSHDPDNPDWGILDENKQLRIKNLGCPGENKPPEQEITTPTTTPVRPTSSSLSTEIPNTPSSIWSASDLSMSSATPPNPPSVGTAEPDHPASTLSDQSTQSLGEPSSGSSEKTDITSTPSNSPQSPVTHSPSPTSFVNTASTISPTSMPLATPIATKGSVTDPNTLWITITLCVVVYHEESRRTTSTLSAGPGGNCASLTPIYMEPSSLTSSASTSGSPTPGATDTEEPPTPDILPSTNAFPTLAETPLRLRDIGAQRRPWCHRWGPLPQLLAQLQGDELEPARPLQHGPDQRQPSGGLVPLHRTFEQAREACYGAEPSPLTT
ncbi:glycoside hydrolase family 17 protein [Amniculicola lignicola CBS 123094]|uniref:glucan endo-1,3-beta-D-glucosidase n=1 Tax=Amniculicola lignicola CBS 123094 TaxID=1392246 RepID=A0A6A5W1A1_9PLEO|nr:glycoside hydrolase family 17 protein [Amniculicola lignicola CBS 123094]